MFLIKNKIRASPCLRHALKGTCLTVCPWAWNLKLGHMPCFLGMPLCPWPVGIRHGSSLVSTDVTWIWRYIFAISPVNAIAYLRKRVMMSTRLSWSVGPTIMQSLRESPDVIIAEVSITTRNYVVLLSTFTTKSWGIKYVRLMGVTISP